MSTLHLGSSKVPLPHKQIGDWCFQVKGHTVKCRFCSVISPLCATNQHLPVYRDRGIPFFLVTGVQNGHCEKFGASVPRIPCISHFLLLFLLLLQPCGFPGVSKVAPLEVCKWSPCWAVCRLEQGRWCSPPVQTASSPAPHSQPQFWHLHSKESWFYCGEQEGNF